MDLWYGATADMEWYDPGQVTTRGGALVITMDSTATTQAGMTNGLFIYLLGGCGIVIDLAVMIIGSTAPFTAADNHGLDYRSGMLQSWNKFCFTTGYIEVSVTFPGPDQNTQGYVSFFFFFGFSISSSCASPKRGWIFIFNWTYGVDGD